MKIGKWSVKILSKHVGTRHPLVRLVVFDIVEIGHINLSWAGGTNEVMSSLAAESSICKFENWTLRCLVAQIGPKESVSLREVVSVPYFKRNVGQFVF